MTTEQKERVGKAIRRTQKMGATCYMETIEMLEEEIERYRKKIEGQDEEIKRLRKKRRTMITKSRENSIFKMVGLNELKDGDGTVRNGCYKVIGINSIASYNEFGYPQHICEVIPAKRKMIQVKEETKSEK